MTLFMTNITYIRTAYKIVKYYPLFTTILATIHSLMLAYGYDYEILKLSCQIPLILAFILTELSIAFKFCRLHRIMIYYSYSVNLRIWMHSHNFFHIYGIDVDKCRIVMFGIGVLIILTFLIKHYGRKECREICTCSSCKADRRFSE